MADIGSSVTYEETLREENISLKKENKVLKKRIAEEILIKTKEDFEEKYIELPKNISKSKLKKIKKKFKKLGIDTKDMEYSRIKRGLVHIYMWKNPNSFYRHHWKVGVYNDACVDSYPTYKDYIKISIKEFLREEEGCGFIAEEMYNCIPSKYMVFYGTDLRVIKEDVERTMQGFSYKKPKMMKMKDAIKKGLKFKRKKEIIYSCFNQQLHKLSNHSVKGLGYPTIIPIKEYEIAELVINSDEMVEIIEKKCS